MRKGKGRTAAMFSFRHGQGTAEWGVPCPCIVWPFITPVLLTATFSAPSSLIRGERGGITSFSRDGVSRALVASCSSFSSLLWHSTRYIVEVPSRPNENRCSNAKRGKETRSTETPMRLPSLEFEGNRAKRRKDGSKTEKEEGGRTTHTKNTEAKEDFPSKMGEEVSPHAGTATTRVERGSILERVSETQQTEEAGPVVVFPSTSTFLGRPPITRRNPHRDAVTRSTLADTPESETEPGGEEKENHMWDCSCFPSALEEKEEEAMIQALHAFYVVLQEQSHAVGTSWHRKGEEHEDCRRGGDARKSIMEKKQKRTPPSSSSSSVPHRVLVAALRAMQCSQVCHQPREALHVFWMLQSTGWSFPSTDDEKRSPLSSSPTPVGTDRVRTHTDDTHHSAADSSSSSSYGSGLPLSSLMKRVWNEGMKAMQYAHPHHSEWRRRVKMVLEAEQEDVRMENTHGEANPLWSIEHRCHRRVMEKETKANCPPDDGSSFSRTISTSLEVGPSTTTTSTCLSSSRWPIVRSPTEVFLRRWREEETLLYFSGLLPTSVGAVFYLELIRQVLQPMVLSASPSIPSSFRQGSSTWLLSAASSEKHHHHPMDHRRRREEKAFSIVDPSPVRHNWVLRDTVEVSQLVRLSWAMLTHPEVITRVLQLPTPSPLLRSTMAAWKRRLTASHSLSSRTTEWEDELEEDEKEETETEKDIAEVDVVAVWENMYKWPSALYTPLRPLLARYYSFGPPLPHSGGSGGSDLHRAFMNCGLVPPPPLKEKIEPPQQEGDQISSLFHFVSSEERDGRGLPHASHSIFHATPSTSGSSVVSLFSRVMADWDTVLLYRVLVDTMFPFGASRRRALGSSCETCVPSTFHRHAWGGVPTTPPPARLPARRPSTTHKNGWGSFLFYPSSSSSSSVRKGIWGEEEGGEEREREEHSMGYTSSTLSSSSWEDQRRFLSFSLAYDLFCTTSSSTISSSSVALPLAFSSRRSLPPPSSTSPSHPQHSCNEKPSTLPRTNEGRKEETEQEGEHVTTCHKERDEECLTREEEEKGISSTGFQRDGKEAAPHTVNETRNTKRNFTDSPSPSKIDGEGEEEAWWNDRWWHRLQQRRFTSLLVPDALFLLRYMSGGPLRSSLWMNVAKGREVVITHGVFLSLVDIAEGGNGEVNLFSPATVEEYEWKSGKRTKTSTEHQHNAGRSTELVVPQCAPTRSTSTQRLVRPSPYRFAARRLLATLFCRLLPPPSTTSTPEASTSRRHSWWSNTSEEESQPGDASRPGWSRRLPRASGTSGTPFVASGLRHRFSHSFPSSLKTHSTENNEEEPAPSWFTAGTTCSGPFRAPEHAGRPRRARGRRQIDPRGRSSPPGAGTISFVASPSSTSFSASDKPHRRASVWGKVKEEGRGEEDPYKAFWDRLHQHYASYPPRASPRRNYLHRAVASSSLFSFSSLAAGGSTGSGMAAGYRSGGVTILGLLDELALLQLYAQRRRKEEEADEVKEKGNRDSRGAPSPLLASEGATFSSPSRRQLYAIHSQASPFTFPPLSPTLLSRNEVVTPTTRAEEKEEETTREECDTDDDGNPSKGWKATTPTTVTRARDDDVSPCSTSLPTGNRSSYSALTCALALQDLLWPSSHPNASTRSSSSLDTSVHAVPAASPARHSFPLRSSWSAIPRLECIPQTTLHSAFKRIEETETKKETKEQNLDDIDRLLDEIVDNPINDTPRWTPRERDAFMQKSSSSSSSLPFLHQAPLFQTRRAAFWTRQPVLFGSYDESLRVEAYWNGASLYPPVSGFY